MATIKNRAEAWKIFDAYITVLEFIEQERSQDDSLTEFQKFVTHKTTLFEVSERVYNYLKLTEDEAYSAK